jgi:hypothetical protein
MCSRPSSRSREVRVALRDGGRGKQFLLLVRDSSSQQNVWTLGKQALNVTFVQLVQVTHNSAFQSYEYHYSCISNAELT